MEINGGSCRVRLKGEEAWNNALLALPSACRATPASTSK
jgi:hypothetical protein